MKLKTLHLINFKSIATASFDFSDKVNCFIGLNGMGKTNVLDALHYLSFTKSHLGLKDSLAVRYGQEASVLDASYQTDTGDDLQILLQIRPGQRKILKRNKKEYERLSEHIGQFPLVIISPQDYQLILGTSKERQRFLDMQLSQQDAVYMSALSQYNKALQQRNTLLKDQGRSDALLAILDEQMSRFARLIWERRKAFVEHFEPIFQTYYSAIAEEPSEIKLGYQSALNETEGELMSILKANFHKDRMLGYTSEGIHKDDLTMMLGDERIKDVGSEGQKKTYLISLKLAQYRLLSQTTSEHPMLLLDDIFDKLDVERVKRIISLVGGQDFGQIFITDTNLKYLDQIIHSWGDDYQLFSVSNGSVTIIDKAKKTDDDEEK